MHRRGTSEDSATVMEIRGGKSQFTFRLFHPEQLFRSVRPVVTESSVRVSESTVLALCNRLESLALAPDATPDDFKDCGRALYLQLTRDLGEELRAKIASLGRALVISVADTDVLPWELLHDGEDFWGLKYAIARQVRTELAVSEEGGERPLHRFSRCLVVANPVGDEELAGLEEQAWSLAQDLESMGIPCKYLAREGVTPEDVVIELSSSKYDIFYYAGHIARVDESGCSVLNGGVGDYALQLSGGWLRCFELARACQGLRVVFLNGCRSARGLDSLAGAFLRQGAEVVVGTVYRVSPYGAGAFADAFFELALKGQPAGEAVRLARKAVREEPKCGNAWACYVMYGDPYLRLLGPSLPKALRRLYDERCRSVIERCLAYAGEAGVVRTPHLLAALLEADNGALGEELRKRGIPARRLREVLGFLGSAKPGWRTEQQGVEVSESVAEIMELAEHEAARRGSRHIGERDLLAAIAEHGGGSLRDLLAMSGINLKALARGASTDRELGPDLEFSPEARLVLDRAAAIARSAGSALVGTPHVFLAFLQHAQAGVDSCLAGMPVPAGRIAEALRRELGAASTGPAAPAGARVELSPNLRDALRAAAEAAGAEGRAGVTPVDLLRGVVVCGGRTVQWLRGKLRWEPASLFSRVFSAAGELRDEAFDENARRVLADARRYAALCGWPEIRTPHLFMGLCSDEGGTAARLISAQGIDAGVLVEGLRSLLSPSAPPQKVREMPGPATVSARVRRLLLEAESLALSEGSEAISERHLLMAFLREPGETGKILAGLGVSLARMQSGLARGS